MLVIFFALLFTSFSTSNDPSLDVTNIPEPLFKDAHIVIRYEDINCHVKALDKMVIEESAAVTILNEKGKGAGTVAIRYTDGKDKLKDIKIEVFDARGNLIKKVNKKEIIDMSVSDGFSIANDARRKHYTYVSNSYPYTIKYSFTKESKNTLWIPDWYPLWSTSTSVQKSSYTINSEIEDYSLITKEYNIDHIDAKIDYTKNSFQAENIHAIKFEPQSPAFRVYVPHVRIVPSKFEYFDLQGGFTDWKSYGKWMYDHMLTGRNQLPLELISELDKKIPESATDEEKARIIYDHVTHSTRYVSVQLGIGGFMPFKCEDVYNLKYGDCKALSHYTGNLLRHYGVEAIYTEINMNADYNMSYDETLPGPGQGNHIVLCLPGELDTTWLECTSQSVLFGYTHDGISNRRALLIKPEGGELVKTKSYTIDDNRSVTNAQVKLDIENDEATIRLDNKYYNQRYERMRRLVDENDKGTYLKSYYYPNLPSLSILSYDLQLDSSAISANEKAEFNTKSLVEKAGNYIIFPCNIMNLETGTSLNLKRKRDIYIKESSTDEATVSVRIPEGYTAVYKKESEINYESEFGSVQTSYSEKSETIELLIKVSSKKGTYAADKVNDYNEYIKHRNKALDTKLIFKPTE